MPRARQALIRYAADTSKLMPSPREYGGGWGIVFRNPGAKWEWYERKGLCAVVSAWFGALVKGFTPPG